MAEQGSRPIQSSWGYTQISRSHFIAGQTEVPGHEAVCLGSTETGLETPKIHYSLTIPPLWESKSIDLLVELGPKVLVKKKSKFYELKKWLSG